MQKDEGTMIMTICPKSSESRWIALGENDAIISEGKSPSEVSELAEKITKDFFLMFVPKPGTTYVF